MSPNIISVQQRNLAMRTTIKIEELDPRLREDDDSQIIWFIYIAFACATAFPM